MISATIFEAKTNLSELVKKARMGETVIITSGRSRTPVAKLEAIEAVPRKRLGALETPGFVLTKAFFEPLPEQELRLWNGQDEPKKDEPKKVRRRARK
jgi:prevent-host-death family protein